MTNWYGQPPSPEQHPDPNSTQPLNWGDVQQPATEDTASQYSAPGYATAPGYTPPAYTSPEYAAWYESQRPNPGPEYWYPPQPGQAQTGHWQPVATHPVPAARKPRRGIAALAMAAIVALAVGGTVIATSHSSGGSQTSAITNPYIPSQRGNTGSGNAGSGSEGTGGTEGGSSGSQGQFIPTDPGTGGSGGQQTDPTDPSTGSGTTTGQTATAAQSVGVVDIDTVLNYGQGEAAGTGMVLTANGEILTNNHVVDEATSISVTIVSTGKKYTATVVGTDATDDVAVLQLKDASGLTVANIGDSSTVAVGDSVTAVGNAGGTGGTPSAAAGTVTALNKTITASDQGGSNSETLNGMIEVNADIQAGDSGGPLYSSSDKIIGMDTAASSGRTTETTGYAIPITKALSIAGQIESGNASDTIHIGNPGFLGVEVASSATAFGSTGATISGTVANSAAAAAGLQAGDTITAVNGTAISSASVLTSTLANTKAGQQVSVTWTDSSGQSHTTTVTLGSGPAD